MTPEQFTAIREGAGLTKSGLAALLRVTYRSVQHWETGEREISGPVAYLMELLGAKRIP